MNILDRVHKGLGAMILLVIGFLFGGAYEQAALSVDKFQHDQDKAYEMMKNNIASRPAPVTNIWDSLSPEQKANLRKYQQEQLDKATGIGIDPVAKP